jgi:hypothetical protein
MAKKYSALDKINFREMGIADSFVSEYGPAADTCEHYFNLGWHEDTSAYATTILGVSNEGMNWVRYCIKVKLT